MWKAPRFWWRKTDWRVFILSPFSILYSVVARRRLLWKESPQVPTPVLCIGNFIVGGAGKTPAVIAFAKAATELGLKPGVVSRGYGSSFSGAHFVNPEQDNARLTGDEPLLIAHHAPVAISRNRAVAAQLLIGYGCNFLIMDDGFQSAWLYTDYAVIVIDSERSIGNGHVFPAGPLRASLIDQLRKADALLKVGTSNNADQVVCQATQATKPTYAAQLVPSSPKMIFGNRFLAFAGIGNPEKFFNSITALGGILILTRSFPNHYVYRLVDLEELTKDALAANLRLITTRKDYVRLAAIGGISSGFLNKLNILDVELIFNQSNTAKDIIETALERYRQRSVEE